MKTWVDINNRLFEIERMKEKNEEVKKEWDKLLSSKIPGILKRNKYYEEVPKRKVTGRKGKKENIERKNVAIVPPNMEGETTLL